MSNNLVINAFLYEIHLVRRGMDRQAAAVVNANKYTDDGAKLTVSVVLCIPFRIGNVI